MPERSREPFKYSGLAVEKTLSLARSKIISQVFCEYIL